MKVLKIIFGFILVFSASYEYVSMCRQLGTYFPPAGLFMAFILIILAALLLTSGMSSDSQLGEPAILSHCLYRIHLFCCGSNVSAQTGTFP